MATKTDQDLRDRLHEAGLMLIAVRADAWSLVRAAEHRGWTQRQIAAALAGEPEPESRIPMNMPDNEARR